MTDITTSMAGDLAPVARLVVETHAAAPCAAVGAARRVDGRWMYGWGAWGRLWLPAGMDAPLARLGVVFDLASVSKPVTALTLARLERAGLLSRSEPLSAFLPELADSASGSVPLDLLCAHRAGLEAHIEFFVKRAGAIQPDVASILRRAADARRAGCVTLPAESLYSDLGYILVGAALERRTGSDLDTLVEREVATPLGLRLGSARKLSADRTLGDAEFVPTEVVEWRGGMLRGIVHDENAWVLAGRGAAGHAGMFGDVRSVVSLGVAIADALAQRSDAWLRCEDLQPLIRARPGGTHAAGFDRRGVLPSSGAHFGAETFGHLGFTGTSLWIDPEQELVGVLLTNRVHPTRAHLAIQRARPAAYDALFAAMDDFTRGRRGG